MPSRMIAAAHLPMNTGHENPHDPARIIVRVPATAEPHNSTRPSMQPGEVYHLNTIFRSENRPGRILLGESRYVRPGTFTSGHAWIVCYVLPDTLVEVLDA